MNNKIVCLVLTSVIILLGCYFFIKHYSNNNSQINTNNTSVETGILLTDAEKDQIFKEVSSKFGLNRSELQYFAMFGLDKVSYGIGPDGIETKKGYGKYDAYKSNGEWFEIYLGQSVRDCKDMLNIPEQYRPECADFTTDNSYKYMDNSRGSTNYSESNAIYYIKNY
ncbi:MAG: hypothetical protein ACD_58C00327G0003 [uncultured bacterium]|nr:MAG: hypothetical protein ACD_58C00327G0003 [uncultured bacterium]